MKAAREMRSVKMRAGSGWCSKMYDRLFSFFGPQYWWPGETPFEVMVGAVLTQNTNWGNVEKAIRNLKEAKALDPDVLFKMRPARIAKLIKPAGYFNVKAKRLKSFIDYFVTRYSGKVEFIRKKEPNTLREELLGIHGIGPETADSILVYALEMPVFVIDAYTKRVASRHGFLDFEKSYEEFQNLFHSLLPADTALFNEYHALLVKVGKEFCRPKPVCTGCPLNDL